MADEWGDNAGWGDADTAGAWGSGDAAAGWSAGDGKKKGCFKCGEEGHNKADCPKVGGGGDTKKGCFKCGEEGHNKADCPQAGEEKKRGCFNCGAEGHSSRDCEKPAVCRRCGQEGHMSRDCSEPEKTRVVEGEDGTRREIYVPAELSDDQLFAHGIAQGSNFSKYEKIKTRCTGDNVPPPIKDFAAASLRSLLNDNIKKCGYSQPTPIQKSAIPCIKQKRDMMACAQTGSGKSAAFLLPILHALLEEGCDSNVGARPQKPQAIILEPTRELAIQIKDEARKFADGSVMKSVVLYGGTSVGYQVSTLTRGCNLLFATPGRLMDIVDKGLLSFEDVRYLVLDEADRMLDMGFLPVMQRLVSVSGMPPKGERVTLMFSATFPDDVQKMAADFLNDYVFLVVGMVGAACDDVVQTVIEVDKFAKRDKLVELLQDVGTDRTMVFVETKKNADFIAAHLSTEGLPATSIHGDRLQREREEALNDFRSGKRPIIVATGVASRGLDIRGVQHVINYDLPKDIEEYVHRIGRTGRVGNVGRATAFYDSGRAEDVAVVPSLVTILANAQQVVPDFLAKAASGGRDVNANEMFGGQDIRGGGAVAEVTEDDW